MVKPAPAAYPWAHDNAPPHTLRPPRPDRAVARHRARPHPAGDSARGPGRHRHQGGLRRRRLRRLHRGAGRGAPGPHALPGRQQLHPPGPFHRRHGAVDGGGPDARPADPARVRPKGQRTAPRAGGAGPMPRLAVRVLHAGFCHEPVRPVPERGLPEPRHHARAGGRGAVGQPVPLHGLPPHPGCRTTDAATAARAGGRNRIATTIGATRAYPASARGRFLLYLAGHAP